MVHKIPIETSYWIKAIDLGNVSATKELKYHVCGQETLTPLIKEFYF